MLSEARRQELAEELKKYFAEMDVHSAQGPPNDAGKVVRPGYRSQ